MTNYIYDMNNVYLKPSTYAGKAINSVNLQGVPYQNNDMSNAFANCSALTKVNSINTNTESMAYCFTNCQSLTAVPYVPNSVTNAHGIFSECANLTTGISSYYGANIIDMDSGYKNCTALKSCSISNTVTTIANCFYACTNLGTTSVPMGVVNMSHAFENTAKLGYVYQTGWVVNMCRAYCNSVNVNRSSAIPYSVRDLSECFYNCTLLNIIDWIPYFVTNTYRTFDSCSNLPANMVILAEHIENATDMFANTSSTKNVYIPFKYSTPTQLYGYVSNTPVESNGDLAIGWCKYMYAKVSTAPTIQTEICFSNGQRYGAATIKDVNTSTTPWKINVIVNGHEITYTRDSSQDISNTTFTHTYNTFIAAGYSTSTPKHGVTLKDLNTYSDMSVYNYSTDGSTITVNGFNSYNCFTLKLAKI